MNSERNNYEIQIQFVSSVETIGITEVGDTFNTSLVRTVVIEDDLLNKKEPYSKWSIILDEVPIEVLTELIRNDTYNFIKIKITNLYKNFDMSLKETRVIIDTILYITDFKLTENIFSIKDNAIVKLDLISLVSWYLHYECSLSSLNSQGIGIEAFKDITKILQKRYPDVLGVHFDELASPGNYAWEMHRIPSTVKDIDALNYFNEKFKVFLYPCYFFLSDMWIPYNKSWNDNRKGLKQQNYILINMAQFQYETNLVNVESEEFKSKFNERGFSKNEVVWFSDFKLVDHKLNNTLKTRTNFGVPDCNVYGVPTKDKYFRFWSSSPEDSFKNPLDLKEFNKSEVIKYRQLVDENNWHKLLEAEENFIEMNPTIQGYTFKDIDLQYLNYKNIYNITESKEFNDRLIYKKVTFVKGHSTNRGKTSISEANEMIMDIKQEVKFLNIEFKNF